MLIYVHYIVNNSKHEMKHKRSTSLGCVAFFQWAMLAKIVDDESLREIIHILK